MTLEKILKLDEINDILKQNNIFVRKNKSDIDFITKNKTTEFFNQWFLDIISFLGYNLPLLLS